MLKFFATYARIVNARAST